MNRSRAQSLLYVAPFLAAVLWLFLPVIAGEETLFLRDVFNTHLEMKAFQAEAMRSGGLPLIDPYRSGGQPHLGNPNTVPLYPDNLLYLIASPIWALNAHFWLHLLLAPLAFRFLGRAIGLGGEAAWAAGVVYATGGYFLSTLNLYNLTATTTLAPAFCAAAIALGRDPGGRRAQLAVALLWALLVLGGDPMTACVTLAAGGAASWLAAPRGEPGLRRGARRAAALGTLALAVAVGTLLAAPQVIEFLRIAPGSYRGVQGYSVAAATAASWSPANLFEWLVPMAFGEPDLYYWGERFHAGRLPLLYSLYPGLLALVLALSAGRRVAGGGAAQGSGQTSVGRWVAWSWGLIGVGLFLAMGSYNPVASWILSLPGMSVFRLPVKLWLLVGIGAALLAGCGLERLLRGRGERTLRRLLVAFAGGLALLGGALIAAKARMVALVGALMPARIPAERAVAEVERWTGSVLLSLLLLAAALVVLVALRRRPALAGAALVALHVLGQVLFLAPLVPTDAVAAYRLDSPLLASIPPAARVVHGDAGNLFGPAAVDPSDYPDPGLRWLQRDTFAQLYPPAGALAGRRYELWSSPEGLDSFLTRLVGQALPLLDDRRRVALLEASGVTHLLLGRELEGVAAERVTLLATLPTGTADTRLYRLERSATEVRFVGRVLRAAEPRQAILRLTDPTFDPRSATVLAGTGEPQFAAPGRLEVVESGADALRVRVASRGGGAIVFQRSFLPIWAASLDGRPVDVVLADMHRMAVEVPPGEHEVALFVDRTSLGPGLWLSLLGVALLAVRALESWRRRGADEA